MDKLLIPLLILVVLVGSLFLVSQKSEKKGSVGETKSTSTTEPGATAPDKKPKPVSAEKLLPKANEALDKGDFRGVLQILGSAREKDDPAVQALMGYAYAGLQDYPSAMAAFEKALLKKRELRDVYSLAYICETLGEYAKAKPLYQELEKGASALPKTMMPKVWLGLARTAAWCGDQKIALESFKKVIRQDPSQEEAFVGYFKALRRGGPDKDLAEIMKLGDQSHGEKFDYAYWKGYLLYETGKDAEALEAFRKCMALNPENSSPYYFSYKILRKSKKIEEAIGFLQKYWAMNPLPFIFFQAALDAHKENRHDLAFVFLRGSLLTERSLLGNNDEGTIEAVNRYISEEGKDEEKRFMKAFMAYINGEMKDARDQARELMSSLHDPKLVEDSGRILRECQRVILGQKAYDLQQAMAQNQVPAAKKVPPKTGKPVTQSKEAKREAQIDDLKRQARNNPNDPRLQYSTALKLAQLGALDDAKSFLRETIRANPGVSEAYYSMARILLFEKNTSEAISSLEQAVKVRPENSQARSLLASLQLEQGNVEKATEEARSALFANPGNPEARFVLAEVYARSQDTAKALEHINIGLQVETDPDRRSQFEALKKKLSPGE